MDLEVEEDDWEYLLHDSDDRDALVIPLRSSPSVFNMDYFSTTSDSHLPPITPPNLLIPIHFPSTPNAATYRLLHQSDENEEEDVIINNSSSRSRSSDTPDGAAAALLNNKVFFKSGFISKETIESVDMKFLDSSSSPTATSPRKTKSVFEFDEDQTAKISDDVNWIGEGILGDDYVINDEEDGGIIGGLNLWNLGFGGFGAICSFGVAAATLCLILLGNSHKAKQNHNLRFQICSNDDQAGKMKQAVQQAEKFNEAMSEAVTGVPCVRSYYDNAL